MWLNSRELWLTCTRLQVQSLAPFKKKKKILFWEYIYAYHVYSFSKIKNIYYFQRRMPLKYMAFKENVFLKSIFWHLWFYSCFLTLLVAWHHWYSHWKSSCVRSGRIVRGNHSFSCIREITCAHEFCPSFVVAGTVKCRMKNCCFCFVFLLEQTRH